MPQSINQGLRGRRQVLAGGIGLTLSLFAPPLLASGRPLLSLSYGSDKQVDLTEETFAALPWQKLRTHTFWTDGPQEFRGPTLYDVMSVGMRAEELRGRILKMSALNDFQVEVPAEDMFLHQPLIAREMNGKPMHLRDKGPLWLVYPRDERPELQNPVYDERWIWQLSRIQVI